MSIGIVSDEEFESEFSGKEKESHVSQISQVSQVSQVQIVDKPSRGRSDGDVNVPDSLRQIIGEESVINGRQSALSLADQFGVSASSVSAYAKGATSTTTYHTPTQSIISHINKSRQRAVKRASKTLNQALSAISQEKLDYADAKDLSGIAKDMSVIIKNLEPQSDQSDQSGKTPQFVIYAPQFKDERSFEVINVNE